VERIAALNGRYDVTATALTIRSMNGRRGGATAESDTYHYGRGRPRTGLEDPPISGLSRHRNALRNNPDPGRALPVNSIDIALLIAFSASIVL
jgi:hypothetical protein